jgi:hypothetical protein
LDGNRGGYDTLATICEEGWQSQSTGHEKALGCFGFEPRERWARKAKS